MKKVILLTVALVIDWLSVAMAQVWVNPQRVVAQTRVIYGDQ